MGLGYTVGNVDDVMMRRRIVSVRGASVRIVSRSSLRLVAGLVSALLLFGAVTAGTAAATTAGPVAPRSVVTVGAAAAATPTVPPTTAPAGPDIDQQIHQADNAQAKRKLLISVLVVVLLTIVVFGHRRQSRHRIRLRNLQNAKG